VISENSGGLKTGSEKGLGLDEVKSMNKQRSEGRLYWQTEPALTAE
jgi:hypothetical protein